MKKLIFKITMNRSKKYLCQKYTKEWYQEFHQKSSDYFKSILPRVPDIGKSIFSFNYIFGPAYISWFKAFADMGLGQKEIDENIWQMNEQMTHCIPKVMLHAVGKSYFNSFRKKAADHIKRQNTTGVHPYDWQIAYRDIDENCFEINITACGMKRLAEDFGAEGMMPGVCRMDYLFASLMGNGFERTKTLGDGDDCCNCRYYMTGSCEWAPEKGFTDRK